MMIRESSSIPRLLEASLAGRHDQQPAVKFARLKLHHRGLTCLAALEARLRYDYSD